MPLKYGFIMVSNAEKYKILIIGGSGLIGRALTEHLEHQGHEVSWLGRHANHTSHSKSFVWDLQARTYDSQAFQDVDIYINLAGSSISDGLWTAKRKLDILNSRIDAIQLLLKGLHSSANRPQLIINGSAIGYYGSQPLAKLDESSSPGSNDILSKIVKKWEAKAEDLSSYTERLVIARTGLVLSNKGGLWTKLIMTKAIRLFNWFGNGHQMYSWIHIDDYCKAISFIITHQSLSGPVNLTSPHPSSQKNLMQSIRANLHSISFGFGIPVFVLKLFLGDLASMLMTDACVLPNKLLQQGFQFDYPSIDKAVQKLMKSVK